ncbi:LuxR C-terminal-related transcriptional regulator [Cucumibacter marinus]|uniref:LuxR C-terminal-related transcriptional regulator n=1 Tax=Cucumibacter marinus TaxID=1121252 RepID=UPI0006860E9E|nr:LuxR C-terminal-related transcriptional regulator [Cucumibacter marinus]
MSKTRGRPPHDDALTPAEWRVVEGVRHGLGDADIARRLGVSRDAVKFHIGNVLGKLDLESRAALRRWDGVRKDSAMSGSEAAGDLIAGIGQIARSVTNLGAAEAWYRDVLGLPHLFTMSGMAFFDCGGVRLMLSEGEGNVSLIYFRVADIKSALAGLEKRGAEVISAPHQIHVHEDGTEEWMAFINDNEGRPIGLMATAVPNG